MAKRKDWPKWHHAIILIAIAASLFGIGLLIGTIMKVIFF